MPPSPSTLLDWSVWIGALALFIVSAFYFLVSAYINIGVFFIRCCGSSGVSSVLGAATLSGLLAAPLAISYFHWLPPLAFVLAPIPDLLVLLGAVVLHARIQLLGLPDKRNTKNTA